MDRIQIRGGAPLNGAIPISGAKNAALPLMIASLLTDQTLTLENLPRLADVAQLAYILGNQGVDYSVDGKRVGEDAGTGQTAHLRARTIVDTTAPYEMVAKMRASFWVIAPLLARMGAARVSLPGGCAIGTRPVDFLLMALEKLGAQIEIDAGYAVAKAPKGLTGAEIEFPKVTVGGTHIAIMAASTARGATLIRNAACEPEVADLAACLNKMGARIRGAGTSTIEIDGVARLNGAHHRVLPDRIEAGTYATAVAMTGGDVVLEGVSEDLLEEALEALTQAGATVSSDNRGVRIKRNGAGISAVDISTAPFPGLPDRSASAVHGADDAGERRLAHQGDHLREPFHARAGARSPRRPDQARWRHGRGQRRQAPARRAGDGDRPARFGFARYRGPCGGRGDDRQSRLSPRPRLRAAGREARRLRRRHHAARELRRWRLAGRRSSWLRSTGRVWASFRRTFRTPASNAST